MKFPTLFLLAGTFVLFLAIACNKAPKPTTFEATFYTDLAGLSPDNDCPDPYVILNTQKGEGSSTLMEKFTTSMTFCVDTTNLKYTNVQGSFVDAETSEEIFITGGGQVKPTEKEEYDMEFQDTISIIGGTGKYEGATGTLVSDSYVKMATNRTDHVWAGTITLKK